MKEESDEELMTALLAPRSWEGAIVQLQKQADGSYTTFFWRDGRWHTAGIAVGKLASLPEASPEDLRRAGLSKQSS